MLQPMLIEQIFDYCLSQFDGVVVDKNWGERGLFYNPDKKLAKGIYVLTIKEKDGPNDNASNVDRDGVYRLNLGVSKTTFIEFFGAIPTRPAAGKIVNTGHDFTQLDQITPHPVYGWMSWVAVLNPSEATFINLQPLIYEAVQLAKEKYAKKVNVAFGRHTLNQPKPQDL